MTAGGSQIFTLTPQPDYAVSGILVDGIAQPLAQTYQFTNVTGNKSIAASFSLSPQGLWKQSSFGANAGNPLIAGNLADPDADGIVNLLEYAAGTSPPVATTISCEFRLNAGTIEFTYPVAPSATDVSRSVEWNDALQAALWSTAGVSSPVPVAGSNRQMVTIPASTVTSRFVRLKVSMP